MEQNIVPYQVSGHAINYHMPKEVDHHVAQKLCKELDMLIEAYQIKELTLDFIETEFMDSSGIGVVIGRSKTLRFRDGKLYVRNLNHRIDAIFRAIGLYKVADLKEE